MTKKIENISDIPGVGEKIGNKLKKAGYIDLMSLAAASPMEVSEAASIGEVTASKIIKTAREVLNIGFEKAADVYERRQKIGRITTGSKNLDNLLGGGMETQAVTELHGAFGSGKCMTYETPIITNRGVIPIGELFKNALKDSILFFDGGTMEMVTIPKEPLEVYSLVDGTVKPRKIKYLYKGTSNKIVEILTWGGRKLRVTPTHPLLILRNGFEEPQWVKAREVSTEDFIAVPLKVDHHFNCKNDVTKLIEEHPKLFFILKNHKEVKNLRNLKKEEVLGIRFISSSGRNKSKPEKSNVIPLIDCINEDLAELVGYLLSDGYLGDCRIFANTDKKLCERVKELVEKIFKMKNENVVIVGPKWNKKSKKCFYQVKLLKGRTTLEFLRAVCRVDAKKARKVRIPKEVFFSSLEAKKRFLHAYMAGDGWGRNNIVSYSPKMITDLAYLYLELGKETSAQNEHKYLSLVKGENKRIPIAQSIIKIKKILRATDKELYSVPWTVFNLRKGKTIPLAKTVKKILKNAKKRIETLKNFDLRSEKNKLKSQKIISNIYRYSFYRFYKKITGKSLNPLNLKKGWLKDEDWKLFITMIERKKGQNIKKAEKTIRKTETLLNSSISFVEVKKVKIVNWNNYVYDVSFGMDKNPTFIGGNVPTVLHNTQVGFQLAVNVQLPVEKGGLNGSCIFLDVEGTFRPSRINQIAEAQGLDIKKVLENIYVARCYNSDHQMVLAEKVGEMIKEKNVKLVIVDSVTSAFRADFIGRGTLAARQQKLNRHLHTLQRLADVHNVAVYITNQVMSRPDILFGDPTKPIGGHILAHFCLPPDTLVQLADGRITEIENMHNPLEVKAIDMENNLKIKNARCKDVFLNTNAPILYEIDTNFSVRATPEHTFFTIDEFDIIETPAKELKPNDYIAFTKKLEFKGTQQKLPKVKNPVLVKLNKKQSDLIKNFQKRKGVSRDQIAKEMGIKKRQLRRILNQNYPTYKYKIEKLARFLGLKQKFVNDFSIVTTHKHRKINIPKILSPKLAQVLGYFIGNGGFEEFSLRFREERKDVLKEYQKIIEDVFKIKTKIRKVKNKNCWNLDINSVVILNLFKKLTSSFDYISQSQLNCVAAFIKGFADAEACVSKKDGRITIGQMDEKILKFIQMLLLRFEITTKISKAKNGWILGVYGTNIRTFKNKIGLTASDKMKHLEKYCSSRYKYKKEIIPVKRKLIKKLLKRLGLHPSKFLNCRVTRNGWYRFINKNELKELLLRLEKVNIKDTDSLKKINFLRNLVNSNIGWQKIRKIKEIKNYKPLYDLTISNCKNFIANGCLVHNSTHRVYLRKSKANRRIARVIDSPNLPEAETVFFITPEGIRDPEE